LGLQDARALANDEHHRGRSDPVELAYTVRDALRWATINGAKALGIDDRIGSLTPGKQADIIVVGAGNDRLNMLGVADPVGAVVQQANASNVQTVLVSGRIVKENGRLVGVDLPRIADMLDQSRHEVLARTLQDGPILPEPKPSFDDLALALLPNQNVHPATV
jgi:5-methylthioadenosine/S-adenosylhomocysteine deaminase